MLQFKILGPLEVVSAGRAVTPGPTKLRATLALLCARAGTVVPRDRLVDALWSGEPPRTARTALQVYVSQLRKSLNEHGDHASRLVSKPHGYLLDLDSDALDLFVFDRLSQRARSEIAGGHLDEALHSLREACALWRGPAFADLRWLPAFGKLARHLDEKRIDVLERRIDLQLRMGQHKDVIGELYGLADEYPMSEAVHAQLMLSLYRSGRIAESLDVYRTVRDCLVRELGMEPGDRIRHLHQSILTRDRSLDEQQPFSVVGGRGARAQ